MKEEDYGKLSPEEKITTFRKNFKGFSWSEDAFQVPNLWCKNMKAFQLRLSLEENKFGQVFGAAGNDFGKTGTFVPLKEGAKYGYIVTKKNIFYCWEFYPDEQRIALMERLKFSVINPYFGHLTFAVCDMILGDLKTAMKTKYFQEKLPAASKLEFADFEVLQRYINDNEEEYKNYFSLSYGGRPLVWAAGEFKVKKNEYLGKENVPSEDHIGEPIKSGLILDISTDISFSGHFKPNRETLLKYLKLVINRCDGMSYFDHILLQYPDAVKNSSNLLICDEEDEKCIGDFFDE